MEERSVSYKIERLGRSPGNNCLHTVGLLITGNRGTGCSRSCSTHPETLGHGKGTAVRSRESEHLQGDVPAARPTLTLSQGVPLHSDHRGGVVAHREVGVQ